MPANPESQSLDELEAEMSRLLDCYRLSPGTERAYDKHWRAFVEWCEAVDRPPLPADDETVAAYVAEGVATHTSEGHVVVVLAAIAERHRRAGHLPPGQKLAKSTRAGIAKLEGHPSPRRRPLTADLTELAALAAPAESAFVLRSRALLLASHGAEIPHAHLRHLDPGDIQRSRRGLLLALPPHHNGKRAVDARVGALRRTGGELCPVSAVERLLEATGALWPETGSLVEQLRRAARRGGVTLAVKPHLGAGLNTEDLWRLYVHVSLGHAVFLRDRAYLLMVHAGPFELSEPLRLRGADVDEREEGLVVHLPWAKPDRFGRHQFVTIPRAPEPSVCPVAAVAEWRRLQRIGADDWLFRSATPQCPAPLSNWSALQSVRRLTTRAGLEQVTSGDVRCGFFVSAKEAGESLLSITMASRVKRLETTRAICAAVPPERRRAPRAVGM